MMVKATTREKGYFARKMGPLQRQLRQGEYGLFKFSPMFESNFVQICKQGGPIEIHNQEEIVTVAITSTSPVLLIPNVLLLARPIVSPEEYMPKLKNKLHRHPPVRYELTRLFPLRFVKITVHNAERQQLRFKLANGRTFYLQLCPDSEKQEDLFEAWIRIVQLLRPPSEATLSEKKEKPRKTKGQRKLQELQSAAKQSKGPSSQRTAAPKSIHDATKKASTHQKEVKKRRKPPPSSESITSRQVTIPPSNVESVKAPDPYPSPEREEVAKKQEDTKTPFSKLEEEEEMTKAIPRHRSPTSEKTKAIPRHRSPASEKTEVISTHRNSATKKSSSQPKRKSDPKRKRGNQSRSGHRVRGKMRVVVHQHLKGQRFPSPGIPPAEGKKKNEIRMPVGKEGDLKFGKVTFGGNSQNLPASMASDHDNREILRVEVQKGTARKPNKIVALLRACSWGYPKKDKQGTKAQGKGKKS